MKKLAIVINSPSTGGYWRRRLVSKIKFPKFSRNGCVAGKLWGLEMRSLKLGVIFLALNLGGCTGPRAPLNPPQLISGEETDMAVQLFMQATILMARYYGYQTLDYEVIRAKSEKAGFNALPFMAPETIRATPAFKKNTLLARIPYKEGDRYDMELVAYQDFVNTNIGYNNLVKYYITTGLRASQVICRNYLQNLEERNRYVQFLQDEFGVFHNVANLVLAAAGANKALTGASAISKVLVDDTLDKYQEYRFLSINHEEARVIVETAQNILAEHYYKKVDGRTPPATVSKRTVYNSMYTFSDALNAVSVIEAQCTRAGIRRLLAKAVYATPTNMAIDPITGSITFISATQAGQDADKNKTGGTATNVEGQRGGVPAIAGVGLAAPATASTVPAESAKP